MRTRTQDQRTERERGIAELDAVYDRYVKPLEAEHRGEFVAITGDGEMELRHTPRKRSRRG